MLAALWASRTLLCAHPPISSQARKIRIIFAFEFVLIVQLVQSVNKVANNKLEKAGSNACDDVYCAVYVGCAQTKIAFLIIIYLLKLNDRYVCLNSRASFTLCTWLHGPKSLDESRTNSIIAAVLPSLPLLQLLQLLSFCFSLILVLCVRDWTQVHHTNNSFIFLFFFFSCCVFFCCSFCASNAIFIDRFKWFFSIFCSRMHVDNAKERCLPINTVIYHLLNAF